MVRVVFMGQIKGLITSLVPYGEEIGPLGVALTATKAYLSMACAGEVT